MSLAFVVRGKNTNVVAEPYSKKINASNAVKTKAVADIKNPLDLKILSKFSTGFKELKSSKLSINPLLLPIFKDRKSVV